MRFYDSFEITIKIAVGSPEPKPMDPLPIGDLYELKAWSIEGERRLRPPGETFVGSEAMDGDHRDRLIAVLRSLADGMEHGKLMPTDLLGRIMLATHALPAEKNEDQKGWHPHYGCERCNTDPRRSAVRR